MSRADERVARASVGSAGPTRPLRTIAARALVTCAVALGGAAVAALGPGSTGATVEEHAVRSEAQVDHPATPRFLPPRRAVLISDSALAGLRYTGNVERLTGPTWHTDLEVCRRLVATSCRATGSPRPPTLVQELSSLPFRPDEFDLLVVGTGYNDGYDRFASDVATVVTAAQAAGFEHIAWLDYRVAGTGWPFSNYARMNAILRDLATSASGPSVTVWEYDAFSRGRTGWFSSDRIHLTSEGASRIADWLSTMAASHDVG